MSFMFYVDGIFLIKAIGFNSSKNLSTSKPTDVFSMLFDDIFSLVIQYLFTNGHTSHARPHFCYAY